MWVAYLQLQGGCGGCSNKKCKKIQVWWIVFHVQLSELALDARVLRGRGMYRQQRDCVCLLSAAQSGQLPLLAVGLSLLHVWLLLLSVACILLCMTCNVHATIVFAIIVWTI
jgi:hypothetical protein